MLSFSIILMLTTTITYCMNSYIYLPDKYIEEEIPIGSLVIDLNDEIKATKPTLKQPIQQYTFLEDLKATTTDNSYFLLDLLTGRITTKRYLDRESMCLNKHCADSCDSYCKINLKILLIPSYSIVSLNIMIQDINDNKPQFKPNIFNQTIPENVPIGFKIPIDLAYDADIGNNSIQYYELTTISEYFQLEQDLNESYLALVVRKSLDREYISNFNFTLVAYDGGKPSPFKGELKINIKISDINDNSPKFEKIFYSFTIAENTPIGVQIGEPLKAYDLDEGQNGLVKYSFVNNDQHIFELNSDTGIITLSRPIDFETDSFYSLTVEARDCGVGSLPDYATVEINVLDVNDNQPEISVSFLNSVLKHGSAIYLPENQAPNKYIAFISIIDKDSGENGRVEWNVLVNNQFLNDNSLFTLNRLSNNSFTLNSGLKSSKLFDRETLESINVSIKAWDNGNPPSNASYYNFTIILTDVNDNPPAFDKLSYDFRINENNEPNIKIGQLKATDIDLGQNALFSYAIKENDINDTFRIDQRGQLFLLKKLDREIKSLYEFHVIVTDQGESSLSSTVNVKVHVIDLNDNAPKISYKSLYLNKNQLPTKNTLVLSIDEDLPVKSIIGEFNSDDLDDGLNKQSEFNLESIEQNNAFSISKDGVLMLKTALDREKIDTYELKIICEDKGKPRLSSTLSLLIYVNDKNDNCPKNIQNTTNLKDIYINKDEYLTKYGDLINLNSLLTLKYSDFDYGKNGELKIELQTHEELFKLSEKNVRLYDQFIYTVDILLRIKNNTNLVNFYDNFKIGRYLLKLKISDKGEPSCTINETITLLVGDYNTNKTQVLSRLIKLGKNSSNQIINDIENEIYDRQSKKSDSLKISKMSLHSNALFLNHDYLLLFILIVIIIIIAIFVSLIGTIYFYTKNTRHKDECKKLATLRSSIDEATLKKFNKHDQEDKKLLGNTVDAEILYNDNRYSLSNKSTLSVQSNSNDSEASSTQTKETQSTFDGTSERKDCSMSTFSRSNEIQTTKNSLSRVSFI